MTVFAVERAAKTLHRMSPCTPVNGPTKIHLDTHLVRQSKKICLRNVCQLYQSTWLGVLLYEFVMDKLINFAKVAGVIHERSRLLTTSIFYKSVC